MCEMLIKMWRDVRKGRQVESYVIAFFTLAFAMLSFFGDILSPDLRWAACTMGIGLLVLRSTASEEYRPPADSRAEELPPGVWLLVSREGERIVLAFCIASGAIDYETDLVGDVSNE